MTDELIVRARQNCCRLCLAPDSECVPIFTSFAADKEPLSSKIYSCVNIKVSESDRLSARICHSCISYLNSWQSFKNRCIASQMKQRNWLQMAKKTVKKQFDSMRTKQSGPTNVLNPSATINGQSQSPPSALKSRPMPLPIKIKEEPEDIEEDVPEPGEKEDQDSEDIMKVDLDPLQFLAKEEEQEHDDAISHLRKGQGPQILTSLGLTHINSVNPFSFLSTELGHEKSLVTSDLNDTTESNAGPSVIEQDLNDPNALPSCRICKVSFSTRANAKRHERNIHGKSLDSSTPKVSLKPNPSKTGKFPPEMLGIFDYHKPEKYRHLLTDQKIMYIRRNEEFLKQYQNLTCKCCPKTFPTYKTFMAHMRKKYQTLARNLCFKCLKQFQTKPMFVSHLKKRNCLNLYKVYMNDETIPKFGPYPLTEKVGAKDLLMNKVYECKICSKSLRLKVEFRAHVYDEHAELMKKDVPPGSCGFCGLEVEDPVERKRHYNNMECIVFLKCITCEDKFDCYQKFIEHVYEEHVIQNNNEEIDQSSIIECIPEPKEELKEPKELVIPKASDGKSSDLRLPQSCQICGQHYNNYNNVLRHMEAKHPDQLPTTYKCTKCDVGYPRLSMLRNHMLEVHQSKLPKVRREGIFCRMCSETFEVREKWISHQSDHHSRYTCCQCNFQNKNLEEFKNHIELHPTLASKSTSTTSNRYDYIMKDLLTIVNGCQELNEERESDDKLLKKEAPPAKKIKLESDFKECQICHSVFTSNLGLSNHMRAHNAQDQAKKSGLSGAKIITTDISSKQENGGNKDDVKKEGEPDARFRRMRCRICQRRFSTKKSYRRHMLIDHHVKNVPFIKCSVCQAEFTHEKGLKVHMFKAHGTVLTDEVIEVQFECDVCSTVYRNEEQLNAHKLSVHGSEDIDEPMEETPPPVPSNTSKYWFQCRYCPSNFDTNKKLAIHINSHEEFDSNDYSCKDCGNVYSGRKSLWVHRYKKHPLIPDPSPCNLCNKTFFDKNMLELHVKSHKQGKVLNNEGIRVAQNDTHSFADDEDDDIEDTVEEKVVTPLAQVSCTVCNEKFSDEDLFSKHMQMHESELYTDNPLAAMFDTEPEDPNRFFMSRMGEDGAFVCDLCPKSFPNLTALKVHRNWHFRSDSKQATADPNAVWRGNPKKKKVASHRCQYCNSTFVSSSNLRRHIGELHKREIANGVEPPEVFIEKHLECQKCNMKFQTKIEWVEHKLEHVRNAKHDTTFEWGCEICGKLVSRKERLIQHMNSHLRREEQQNGHISGGDPLNSEAGFESNSQDSEGSSNDQQDAANEDIDNDNENEDEAENKDDEKNDATEENLPEGGDNHADDDGDDEADDESDINSSSSDDDNDDQDDNEDNEDNDDNNDNDDNDDNDDDDSDSDKSSSQEEDAEFEDDNEGPYSCDLCQLYFESSKQLQRHVTSHFLNGPGSVMLTELSKEKRTPTENGDRTDTSS